MAKGELENRDAEELGDLSEDHGLERGEIQRLAQARAAVPTDMRNNAQRRQAAAGAPIGTPQLDYDVRSVYDSRPVQGRDFNEWFSFATEGGGTVPGLFFAQALLVPPGLVAVVRRIMFRCGAIVWDNVAPFQCAVLKNGATIMPEQNTLIADFPGLSLAYIPLSDGDSLDTFIIADEGDTVGIQLFDEQGSPDVQDDITYKVGFYGNFLLKTGVPAPFQIANLAGAKGPPITRPAPRGIVGDRTARSKDPYRGVPIVGSDRLGKK